MELIELLIRLFMSFFMISSATTTAQPPVSSGTMRSYTLIEGVEALVLESFPVQINLQVTGSQPDGCELPVIVEQRREGNLITVEIYREMPMDLFCTMALVPYSAVISLEGGFESGTYTIKVNDYTLTITV